MKKNPYVIISTAMSLDGYIDDTYTKRLEISNEKDFERVKKLRETCDAILVGANTIRNDNPKLLANPSKNLTKVTLTISGNIDPSSNFFTTGDSEKIVYTVLEQVENLKKKLPRAIVVSAGIEEISLRTLFEDLYERGVRRLMIEGGTTILTHVIQEELVDEMHIAIGGFFVGEKNAPRFVNDGNFPWTTSRRMKLESLEKLDDIAVLIYKNHE